MSLLDNLNLKLEEEELVLSEEPVEEGELENSTQELVEMTKEAELATESLSLLYDSYGKTQEEIRRTIIYTCGRLGMGYNKTMDSLKTEEMYLSLEGVIENFVYNIRATIAKIWERIKEFIKKVWSVFQSKYYKYFNSMKEARNKVNELKGVGLLESTQEELKEFVTDFVCHGDFHYVSKGSVMEVTIKITESIVNYLQGNIIRNLREFLKGYRSIVTSVKELTDEEEVKYIESVTNLINRCNAGNDMFYKEFQKTTGGHNQGGPLVLVCVNLNTKMTAAIQSMDNLSTDDIKGINRTFHIEGFKSPSSVVNSVYKKIDQVNDSVFSYVVLENLASLDNVFKDFDEYHRTLVTKFKEDVDKHINSLLKSGSEHHLKIRMLTDFSNILQYCGMSYITSYITHLQRVMKWYNRLYKKALKKQEDINSPLI